MGESARLRLSEVRAVFRLVAECRELGEDTVAWRTHLLQGAMKLVGARVALCGEIVLADRSYTRPQVEMGWEASQGEICHDYWREHLGMDDLLWQRVASGDGNGFLTAITRQDYVTNDEWYRMWHVHDCLRTADVDGLIMSGRMCRSSEPTLDRFTVFRAWGEQLFGQRERRLIHILHDELAPMVGRQLATSREPGPFGLSPRRRDVLECLLEGDTDRQIALRLGISKATVSEYVSSILRHFGVSSRAQLLATFLRRYRGRRCLPEDQSP